MTYEALINLLLQSAVAGGGAWLAVKVELKFLGASVKEAKQMAERAHARIDDLMKVRE